MSQRHNVTSLPPNVLIGGEKQKARQLMVFGYGLPLICAFLAWRQYAHHGWNGWAQGFLAAAVIVSGIAILARPWLEVLFKYWMKVAFWIGAFVTTAVLTVFYFGMITPLAIVLRLLGKDFLRLRRESHAASYWIPVQGQKSDYTQQF